MASSPPRKRPVAASRRVAEEAERPAHRTSTHRPRRAVAVLLEDEPPSKNYALSLTEELGLDEPDDAERVLHQPTPRRSAPGRPAPTSDSAPKVTEPDASFALRLTQALAAITAAQADAPTPPAAAPPGGANERPAAATSAYAASARAAPGPRQVAARTPSADAAASDGPDSTAALAPIPGAAAARRGGVATGAAARRSTGSLVPTQQPVIHQAAAFESASSFGSADADDDLDADELAELLTPKAANPFTAWLLVLDRLPPIRLPFGPLIPWRLGLPALLAIVVVTLVVTRPSAIATVPPAALPTALPTALPSPGVGPDSPLFTSAQPVPTVAQAAPAVDAQPDLTQAPPPAATPVPAAPIGVAEPSGVGFDLVDVGVKLAVVLALAYGSLMLLKRFGLGGAGATRHGSGAGPGLKLISSVALAPNRTIHVLQAPGGRTLLIGATPSSVNLLVDLGHLPAEDAPEASTFFETLKGKITS